MCYRIKSERGIRIKVNVHTSTAHKTRLASRQQGHTQTPPTRQQVASRDTHTKSTYKTRLASHWQGHTHKPHLQDSTGMSPAGTYTQTPPTRLDQQVASRDTHTNPTYKTRLASRRQGHTHKPHLQDSKSPAGTHTQPHLQDSTSKSPAGTHTQSPLTRLD